MQVSVTDVPCRNKARAGCGPIRVVGEDGTELPGRRATVALCRCGLTGRPPWCDGSHKVAAAAGRGRRPG